MVFLSSEGRFRSDRFCSLRRGLHAIIESDHYETHLDLLHRSLGLHQHRRSWESQESAGTDCRFLSWDNGGDMSVGFTLRGARPWSTGIGCCELSFYSCHSSDYHCTCLCLLRGCDEDRRNLPYGMLISLLVATILYSLVSFTIAAVLDDGWWVGSDGHVIGNPVAALAEAVGGRPLALFVSALAVLTMISMALAGILASSRFGFAMSRDSLLPPSLETVHLRYETPHVAIIITGVLMAMAIWLLDVHAVAEMASGFQIMIFMMIHVAVMVLRQAKESHAWYQPGFSTPLFPVFQIYGLISGAVLVFFIGANAQIGALAAVVIGLLVYHVYGRKYIKKTISPWKTLQTMLTDPERAKRDVREAAFHAADIGRRDHINLVEFISAMEALGYVDQRAKLRDLFHSADAKYRGYLVIDEFLSQVDLAQESE